MTFFPYQKSVFHIRRGKMCPTCRDTLQSRTSFSRLKAYKGTFLSFISLVRLEPLEGIQITEFLRASCCPLFQLTPSHGWARRQRASSCTGLATLRSCSKRTSQVPARFNRAAWGFCRPFAGLVATLPRPKSSGANHFWFFAWGWAQTPSQASRL